MPAGIKSIARRFGSDGFTDPAMLDVLPVGFIVFPGTGIQNNLADKAKRLGIAVWRFTEDGAS